MLVKLTLACKYYVKLLRLGFILNSIYYVVTALVLLISASLISGVECLNEIVKAGWFSDSEYLQVKYYVDYSWYKITPPRLRLATEFPQMNALTRALTLVSGVGGSVVTTICVVHVMFVVCVICV